MPKIPIRTCIGCGQKRPKPALVRFVYMMDKGILLDKTKCMPGRGAYVCPEIACLERAWKRKAFMRTLKIPLSQRSVMDQGNLNRLKEEMTSLDLHDGGRSKEGDLNEQA